MGLGVFVLFSLSSSYVILFLDVLVTPPSWDLINFLENDSLLSPNLAFYAQCSTTNFSEALPP